ncbi:MAG: restriction endonuclease subunit S [Gemmatimonadota bacterium]|nr:restriction endonuclease subunit S [Gemmatimonadota bacterium]
MVKAGKIRKPRTLSNGEGLVAPFEVPGTWCWDRLDAVGAIVGGGTPRASDPRNFSKPGEGIAWLTPKDLGGHRSRHIERGSRDLSPRGLQSSSATLMPAGTVLFSSRAPIGYVAIAANAVSTNQGFKSIVPYVSDCSAYIALAMQAFAPGIENSASGTTFKEVSGRIVAGVPFPLPPLAEQHRIVAKVDELFALCDRLEETRIAREDARDRLTRASLARVSAADTDAAAFRGYARFAIHALPALTAHADQVKHLRQTIFGLAVRGKLVEQNSADEPALALLKRIAAEKARMVRAGEIRKPRSLSNGEALETPFEIPAAWCWDRLDAIGAIVGGGTPPASDPRNFSEPGNGIAWLTPKDLGGHRNRHIRRGNRDLSLRGLQYSSATLMPAGTVLFSSRAPIGYVAIAANAVSTNQGFKSIVPYVSDCSAYIALVMRAFAPRIEENASGTTFKEVSGRTVAGVPFPLPPLPEQRRIVARVDELMALCDQLEAGVGAADGLRSSLLNSLLHESLTSETASPSRTTSGGARDGA